LTKIPSFAICRSQTPQAIENRKQTRKPGIFGLHFSENFTSPPFPTFENEGLTLTRSTATTAWYWWRHGGGVVLRYYSTYPHQIWWAHREI